jgi:hypothetical protein
VYCCWQRWTNTEFLWLLRNNRCCDNVAVSK